MNKAESTAAWKVAWPGKFNRVSASAAALPRVVQTIIEAAAIGRLTYTSAFQ